MPLYPEGHVVIALFPYSDGFRSKPRPAIILQEVDEYSYKACKCSTTDRTGKIDGRLTKTTSDDNLFFNFSEDTFIEYGTVMPIHEDEIFKVLGNCPRMIFNEILGHN